MKNRPRFSPAQFILLGFALVIFVGSLILTLPICSADGTVTPYIDALFTSTTSVCVTGLVTVSTANHWSTFGQFMVLLLIQFGGLGVVAVLVMIMQALGKKIGMRNRILIQQSYGLDTIQGAVRFLRRIIKGVLLVEFIGFICYLPVLVAQFGPSGIWKSFFLSISAFCNAGMDLLGDNSLAGYVGNYWINFVTMSLIVLGGLGFIVWWEIKDLLKNWIFKKKPLGQLIRKMSLHAKIVLMMTIVLILLGTVLVFIFEYKNPETLGPLSFPQKIMAAIFQSVTTRTAGFFTVGQSGLTDASSLCCMFLMFIGGSPAGTAGGIKTVTVAMILFAILTEAKGSSEIVVYKRTIAADYVRKALTIFGYSFGIWILMTMILCAVEDVDFMKACYETISAIGTVGLSKDLTSTLHVPGKLVIICLMYAGRIGPVTLATAFLTKGNVKDQIHYADENILLG